MNHNYIIILFLAILLIQVEKIHCGCYPVGMDAQTIGGSEIQEVLFSSGEISVTTNIIEKGTNGTDKYTEGIGHFTFNYDNPNGKHVSVRILKRGVMVNYHDCSGNTDPNEVNPFTRIWEFKPELTPPPRTKVTVKLSIYWECIYDNGNDGIACKHEDVSLIVNT